MHVVCLRMSRPLREICLREVHVPMPDAFRHDCPISGRLFPISETFVEQWSVGGRCLLARSLVAAGPS